ncbi:MAG: peptidylprolyl isomerase [Oscillospiraceae bacterium]
MRKNILAVLSAIILLALPLAGCTDKAEGGSAPKKRSKVDSAVLQFTPPADTDITVVISTSLGDIKAVLYKDEAPQGVENFVGLAQKGYYNNTTFHRVVKDFVIQGGDDTATGTGGTTIWNGTPFAVEVSDKLHHYSGALSYARIPNDRNSNTSQFFIVQTPQSSVDKAMQEKLAANGVGEDVVKTYAKAGGAPYMDGEYTVFGQVYEGMDIVDKIANVEVNGEAPKEPVTVLSVTVTGA